MGVFSYRQIYKHSVPALIHETFCNHIPYQLAYRLFKRRLNPPSDDKGWGIFLFSAFLHTVATNALIIQY